MYMYYTVNMNVHVHVHVHVIIIYLQFRDFGKICPIEIAHKLGTVSYL